MRRKKPFAAAQVSATNGRGLTCPASVWSTAPALSILGYTERGSDLRRTREEAKAGRATSKPRQTNAYIHTYIHKDKCIHTHIQTQRQPLRPTDTHTGSKATRRKRLTARRTRIRREIAKHTDRQTHNMRKNEIRATDGERAIQRETESVTNERERNT